MRTRLVRRFKHGQHYARGFTLVQISILLVVASLVMVAILPSSQSNLTSSNVTTQRMNTILSAMRSYIASYGYLPCPADASQRTSSAAYGVAATGGGASTNCSGLPTGSITSGGFTDSTTHVSVGMVPFRTLGLPADYATDSWGRDITYATDDNATTCWASASQTGAISVYDNGTYTNTVAALVSHGTDGHGAWLPYAGSDTVNSVTRLNAGYAATGAGVSNTDADQLVNAHITTAFAASSSSSSGTGTTPASSEAITGTTFIRKPLSTTSGNFDDLVVYKNSLWTLGNLPTAGYPTMIGSGTAYPVNNTYPVGTVWPFVVTFPSNVNVSGTVDVCTAGNGTPRIKVSALGGGSNNIGTSNTGYACYHSGTGTNAITFNYTVVGSDVDNNGIAVSAPIQLNGGTMSMVGLCFIPPDLSLVLVGQATMQYFWPWFGL